MIARVAIALAVVACQQQVDHRPPRERDCAKVRELVTPAIASGNIEPKTLVELREATWHDAEVRAAVQAFVADGGRMMYVANSDDYPTGFPRLAEVCGLRGELRVFDPFADASP